MASSNAPKFVYKLVPSSAPIPEPLPDRLPISELDQHSGFIHLSTALQVPNTLEFFFKDEPHVYVLRVEYEKIQRNIRWENPEASVCGPPGGEGMFPHLYNGQKLGKDEIESVATWKNENGWDHALENAASWLAY